MLPFPGMPGNRDDLIIVSIPLCCLNRGTANQGQKWYRYYYAMNMQNKTRTMRVKYLILLRIFGAPETIRTSDPCLRRAVLYPTELRARGPRR